MAERPERIRQEPRFSINSLAEYMTATPARRATIVKNQKRPNGGIVARYTQAEEAIVDLLTAGDGDLARIRRAQEVMAEKAAKSDKPGRIQMLENASEALSRFISHADTFALPGAALGLTADGLMQIGGIKVSVRPEVAYLAELRSRRQIGLVKLCFRKTKPVTEVMANYIAVGMYQWGRDIAQLGPELALERCLVYDIFAGRVFAGPRSHVQRLADLQAACAEIVLHWTVA